MAYALEDDIHELGDPDEWQAEWKWDGIRGQIIKRNDELFVWSRGEELMTEKFPEYHLLKDHLPDGIVLDGEIMPFADNKAIVLLLFCKHELEEKILQKNNCRKHRLLLLLMICWNMKEKIYAKRPLQKDANYWKKLYDTVNHPVLQSSPVIDFTNWDELTQQQKQSRDINSEGIMLKRKNSAYGVGRKRGDWWKWKIDPLVIDAVMIYAQKGSGRRSNLYTDYTFAVRDGDKLVSFTKAYSGLTDKEFARGR